MDSLLGRKHSVKKLRRRMDCLLGQARWLASERGHHQLDQPSKTMGDLAPNLSIPAKKRSNKNFRTKYNAKNLPFGFVLVHS
jgi:hypothetical protein